jgi:hypothetical protein
MKCCYSCAYRASYPSLEVCRITREKIVINLDSGIGCRYWQERSCVNCFWDTAIPVICDKKPLTCPYFFKEVTWDAFIANIILIQVFARKQDLIFPEDGQHVRRLKRMTMTRSEKKRAKHQKKATAKGLFRLSKRINSAAKAISILITYDRSKTHLWGLVFFCIECKQYGCYGYGGGIVFCRECRFDPCLKITEPQDSLIKNICLHCGGAHG